MFDRKLIIANESPIKTNKLSTVGKKKFDQLSKLNGFGINKALNIVGIALIKPVTPAVYTTIAAEPIEKNNS